MKEAISKLDYIASNKRSLQNPGQGWGVGVGRKVHKRQKNKMGSGTSIRVDKLCALSVLN